MFVEFHRLCRRHCHSDSIVKTALTHGQHCDNDSIVKTALTLGQHCHNDSIVNTALTHSQHCRDDSIASGQHRKYGIDAKSALSR